MCLKVTIIIEGKKHTLFADKVFIDEEYLMVKENDSTLYFKYPEHVEIEVAKID